MFAANVVPVVRRAARYLVPLALTLLAVTFAAAETDANTSAYDKAVAQVRTAERIAALQSYVMTAHGSLLERDALTLLVWDRLRTGDPTGARTSARRLAEVDAENPVALAVLAGADAQPANRLKLATRGLSGVTQLRAPRGMPQAEFQTLQSYITGVLSGTAGVAALSAKDYGSARQYLRQAVAYFPRNSEYVYSLGVADLEGGEPNPTEGYWYLARAVILTRGTAAGEQISSYAYNRYVEDGGTRDNWSRYLVSANAVTRPPAATTQLRAEATPGAKAAARKPTETAHRGTPPKPPANGRAVASGEKKTPPTVVNKRKQPTTVAKNDKKKPAKKKSEPDLAGMAEEADRQRAASLSLPPPQTRLRPMPLPGGPISVGILIGSAGGNKSDRRALVAGLSEMVRRLRPGDEAFIMSFSDQLDFEQDLTGNYHLLEQAMDHIPPHSGSKLYDAVAFAAGHLRRIAKNRNRVLLVISDGRNGGSRTSPLELAAQINGIRIDCIGMDAGGDGRYLLSSLASHTGGLAQFISDPRQFGTATQYVAQALGLHGGS